MVVVLLLAVVQLQQYHSNTPYDISFRCHRYLSQPFHNHEKPLVPVWQSEESDLASQNFKWSTARLVLVPHGFVVPLGAPRVAPGNITVEANSTVSDLKVALAKAQIQRVSSTSCGINLLVSGSN